MHRADGLTLNRWMGSRWDVKCKCELSVVKVKLMSCTLQIQSLTIQLMHFGIFQKIVRHFHFILVLKKLPIYCRLIQLSARINTQTIWNLSWKLRVVNLYRSQSIRFSNHVIEEYREEKPI